MDTILLCRQIKLNRDLNGGKISHQELLKP